MDYTFRSQEKTVYLELPYKLVINSSSGVALEDGKSTLTASVVKTTDGSAVKIAEEAFVWTRRELSDDFTDKTGSTITVTEDDLVSGSGTFVCTCKPNEFYWADTAFITIEEAISGTAGQNAPYQRFIFKAAVEKPERPGGTSDAIPAGWSLQAPPRLSSEKIWVSTGLVSYVDNVAQYSEWSDPAEWSGSSVMPIVQWQWGESFEYPPNVTNYALLIDGELMVFENSMFIDDFGSWSEEIPTEHPANLKYLWKREYNWNHTSEEDEWIYYPAQGPSGLPGDYQGLGYYIVGTNTVFFMGLDEDKSPTLTTINIFIGGRSYYFNSISADLNNKSDKFYLVATLGDSGLGGLGVYYIKFTSDGTTSETQWLSHDTDERITDGYVLAEIRMDGYAIESVSIVTPKRLTAYEKAGFMEILDGRNMTDINVAAEALGVERVFSAIAALDLFVDALTANEGFIKKLKTNKFEYISPDELTRIRIGTFTDDSGTSHSLFIAEHREAVSQEFEATFQMDISTGNVFFGKPNSSYSAPLYGFMYRASDHYIVGPNYNGSPSIQISSTGKITTRYMTANNATINTANINNATIVNSTLSGLFETTTITTKKSEYSDYTVTFPSSYGVNQAQKIYNQLKDIIPINKYIENNALIPCNIDGYDKIGFLQFSYREDRYISITFFDKDANAFGRDGINYFPPTIPGYNINNFVAEIRTSLSDSYGQYFAPDVNATIYFGDILKVNLPKMDDATASAILETGEVYIYNGTLKVVMDTEAET